MNLRTKIIMCVQNNWRELKNKFVSPNIYMPGCY